MSSLVWSALIASMAPAHLLTPPELVGEIPTPSDGFEVVMMGHLALVPNYSAGLLVIDVTHPSAPRVVGSYDTPGLAVQCALAANLAFVADHVDGGLQVLDLSEPRNPSFLGSYASGDAVVMAAWHDGIVLAGNILGGVDVLDVTDPTQPTWVSSFPTQASPRHAVFGGDVAYVADYEFGIRVMDLSTPSQPVQIGAIAMTRPLGIDRDGDVLFVACAEGLRTVDVSDPTAPSELDLVPLPGPGIKVVHVAGYALVAAHVAGGLQIVDVSNPSDLSVATHFVTGKYTHGVGIDGAHAYLADANSFKALQVFTTVVPARNMSVGGLKSRF